MPLADLIPSPHQTLTPWPSEPLLFSHPPENFHHLLTLAEVDELIDTECVAAQNVVLIKDGKVMERYTYIDGDMPRRGAVRQHLNDGGTVSLRQLQAVKPTLSRLQHEMQSDTGCRVHVNAYLTPPGNQGLKYHYDPYVTLIVQLAGRKTWPLHEPIVPNPLPEFGNFLGRGFTDDERKFLANTPPTQEFTLAPGDVFWLPRGYIHSPYTAGDEPSLHLTFALKERTLHWLADLVTRELLDQALVDPALREGFPLGHLGAAPQDAVAFVREYLIGALLLMDAKEISELATAASRDAAVVSPSR
ncbi:cupin domain-containing protein [Streptomyces sp. NPDC052225]|uniref:JmjC domain-containing protein n=1 Tax=Streptomyces sp. NPDC052225 TaxID=3154949 RepID=UPI00342F0BA9